MNILVICPDDPYNKGTLSILTSMIQELDRLFPKANITFFTKHPEKYFRTYHYRAQALPPLIPLSPTIYHKIMTILSICRFSMWIMFYRFFKRDVKWLLKTEEWKALQAYVKTDIAIATGTDSLSDMYGVLPCMGALYNIWVSVLLKIPIYVISQQIGPFKKGLKGRICRLATKSVLNGVKIIVTRDEQSKQNLSELGVNKPSTYFTADIAFLLNPAPCQDVKHKLLSIGLDSTHKPIIGVNTSALIHKYIPGKSSEEKRKKYVKLISQITDFFIDEIKATVVYFPHVFGPPHNDDRIIAREIAQEVKDRDKLILIEEEFTCEELKRIIGYFDLFLASRMHPAIHAIAMNTPLICLSYSFKFEALMHRIDLSDQVYNITETNFHVLKRKLKATYLAHQEIKYQIREKAKILKKHARQSLSYIEADLQHCTQ